MLRMLISFSKSISLWHFSLCCRMFIVILQTESAAVHIAFSHLLPCIRSFFMWVFCFPSCWCPVQISNCDLNWLLKPSSSKDVSMWQMPGVSLDFFWHCLTTQSALRSKLAYIHYSCAPPYCGCTNCLAGCHLLLRSGNHTHLLSRQWGSLRSILGFLLKITLKCRPLTFWSMRAPPKTWVMAYMGKHKFSHDKF